MFSILLLRHRSRELKLQFTSWGQSRGSILSVGPGSTGCWLLGRSHRRRGFCVAFGRPQGSWWRCSGNESGGHGSGVSSDHAAKVLESNWGGNKYEHPAAQNVPIPTPGSIAGHGGGHRQLYLPDGTLYSIMGPRQSGKSTLLSLLAGLKLPTGEITLDEQPIRLMDRSALRRDTVSVIYQISTCFALTAEEKRMCYPLRLRKEDRTRPGAGPAAPDGYGHPGVVFPASCPTNCPAASSSGWPSPGPWLRAAM